MNKRAILAACVLTLCGWKLKAADTSYTVKVVSVNEAAGRIEARFVTLPEDLRIICKGKVNNMSETDYVKVAWNDGVFSVKGMKCNEIMWVH